MYFPTPHIRRFNPDPPFPFGTSGYDRSDAVPPYVLHLLLSCQLLLPCPQLGEQRAASLFRSIEQMAKWRIAHLSPGPGGWGNQWLAGTLDKDYLPSIWRIIEGSGSFFLSPTSFLQFFPNMTDSPFSK